MNTELLLEIADRISKHPKAFNMMQWSMKWNDMGGACRTTRCIAGYALSMVDNLSHEEIWAMPVNEITKRACKILDIPYGDGTYLGNPLFYSTQWPRPFRGEYLIASAEGNEVAAAEIAARCIKHFIETKSHETYQGPL